MVLKTFATRSGQRFSGDFLWSCSNTSTQSVPKIRTNFSNSCASRASAPRASTSRISNAPQVGRGKAACRRARKCGNRAHEDAPLGLWRIAARARQADHPLLWPLRCAARRAARSLDQSRFRTCRRNGNLYGRGTADDKGQVHIHIKALEALKKLQANCPSM